MVDTETIELFQDGDYYTASVKVPGKRELVKIRGVVQQDNYSGFNLLNNQGVGQEADCSENYGSHVWVSEATPQSLAASGVKDFKVVTDKRIIKLIDNDVLPQIAGHQPRILPSGMVAFGCGSITVTVKQMQDFYTIMSKIQSTSGAKEFFRLVTEIVDEISEEGLASIDLKSVKKILDSANSKN